MRLSPAERLILENQRAIMWAIAYPGEAKTVLKPRIEITGEATIVKKRKTKRRDQILRAFSRDVGDQGYRPLKMPTRP